MTKKSRRAIAAAMLPPKPPPPKLDVRPEQLPAGVASYHFLTDPEIKAAKEIAEYWASHWEGVIWYQPSDLSQMPAEERLQVAAVLVEAPLSDRQRQVLDLRSDNHSWAEIASALDLDVTTVRTHMRRGLDKVREILNGRR